MRYDLIMEDTEWRRTEDFDLEGLHMCIETEQETVMPVVSIEDLN